MRAAVCPTCGRPIAPAEPALPPIKRRILAVVNKRPGITAEQLRGIVWAHDSAGGPETFKVIQVHIWQLNNLLAPLGIAVRGGSNGYRLISTPAGREVSCVPQEGAQLGGVRVRVNSTQ